MGTARVLSLAIVQDALAIANLQTTLKQGAGMMEQIDSTAIEVEAVMPDEHNARAAISAELSPVATAVMMPFDAKEVSGAMSAYQEVVRATLDATDWQGKPGTRGAFVKKSGWRKIAKAFGLSVTRVDDGVERDDDGNPLRAWAIYRAAHSNGQTQDGDGYCSVDESRFAQVKGRQKLENDLRATATTRAKNRAISDLVGMGEVSAEEAAVAAFAPEPYTGSLDEAFDTLSVFVTSSTSAKLRDWIIKDNDGIVPASTGRALVAIGRALDKVEAPEQRPQPTDDLPF